jgi:S-adenosylmethionine/arginine decarboxylase-like enzyme
MSDLVQLATATIAGDCTDSVAVWHRFIYHVAHLPGVTIINSIKHDVPGGGFSGLILLGESHAAIHTWPELGQAWIELATCGDPAALPLFIAWRVDDKELIHG